MTEDEELTGEKHKIECSLGDLDLKVRGPDPEWVEKTFEEKWQQRLEESAEMKEAVRDIEDPRMH